jgi:amino acid adenylation domain-containing protein
MTDWNEASGLDGLEIAIVGMAGRFPGAPDVDRFWENLRDGVESITFYSEEQLLALGGDPRAVRDPAYVRAAAQLPDIDLWDASFFGFSPREAEQMDPQQRVFLECAWEVLEAAGYDPENYPGLIGVYAGSGTNEYLLFHLLRSEADFGNILQLTISNEKDFLATRVSYKLDLRGPSVNIQTGCSSALVAVHLASQALLSFQCDMALAGGVSIQLPDAPGYLFEPGGILSPDGHCRAFSSQAQGAVAGSGAAIVLLKRLADALADGDTVHAVIKGSAINNDGASKIGYTAPSIEGQARVIDLAQAAAAVEPRSISFIEGHGSGTPLGDPIEVAALSRAFRAGTSDRGFCALGSVKSNVGHLDTAAGVAGLIKTALALRHRQIPPTLHFDEPNPEMDLPSSPFYVNARLIDWPAGEAPRRAGVSSFGIGGTNAHVIVEEAPEAEPSSPARPFELLLLSARGEASLERATDNLAAHLASHPSENLSDVAWTLQIGRRRFPHRRMLVASGVEGIEDAREALASRDPRRLLGAVEEAADRPVAFLFPGLGDHYPGMAAGLYRDQPVFRREVDRCAEILAPRLGLDLRRELFPEDVASGTGGVDLRRMLGRSEPGEHGLSRTALAQPALFVIEYALARLWMSWGVRPAALLGYSLGEYVAACVAGVLSLEDALLVVAERARLIGELPAGAMLAVPLPEAEAADLLGERLSIAAVNGPALSVVAGPPEEVAALEAALAGRGISSRPLQTTHAFHSWMMEPIAGRVAELLGSVSLNPPSIPVVSNVTGGWLAPAEATDPAYWAAHLRQPVRFGAGLAELGRESGGAGRALLEVGPGQSLGSLALQHPQAGAGRVVAASLRHAWDLQPDGAFLLSALGRLWLAGCRIDWTASREGERRRRVALPTYPWERQRYWIEPARKAARSAGPDVEPALAAPTAPAARASRYARPNLRNVYVAPSNELERAVAGLWERLLGIEGLGVHDNFFELGGHSLLGTQLVTLAREVLGVELPLQALFETPTVAGMAAAVGAARAAAAPQAPPLIPVERTAGLPLSFAQSRMWFLNQLDPGSPAYNIPFAIRLEGDLRPEVLEAAVREIVRRHESLRTRFPAVEGRALQAIEESPWRIEVPVIDLSDLPEEVREAAVESLGALNGSLRFDLSRGPLLRLTLLRLGERDHALLLNMHHIVSDGWSVGIFLGEMVTLYGDVLAGRPASLPPLPIQYADFAAWQREWLQGEVLERHLDYWRSRLEGRPSALDLPLDHPRGERAGEGGGWTERLLPAPVVAGLRSLAEREGVTPFIALLSAFDVLLGRSARQDDVLVGTPIANRTRAEVSGLIGFFVNTLVLRADLSGDPTFRGLLGRMGESALGAFAYQDLPFEKLVEELHPERALAVTPLFQVMFAYQNAPLPDVELPGLALRPVVSRSGAAMFDLTLNASDAGEGRLSLALEYASDLFEPATAARMLDHLAVFLEAAVAAPDRRISELPLLTEAERWQLVTGWNETPALPAAAGRLLHQAFEARAEREPEAVALVYGRERISCGDLNRRANHLAHRLRERGVGPEVRVGVLCERSPDLVVALLAVLKSGGAYVPLDPNYPPERRELLAADAAAAAVLTREDIQRLEDGRDGNPEPWATPENLAYLIYTSGSTGEPKGVAIRHASAVALIDWAAREFSPEELAGVLASTSVSFDLSVFELFVPLSLGGKVILADNVLRLPELPAAAEVTLVNTVPSALVGMLQVGGLPPSVTTVNLAGEPLQAALVERAYRASGVRRVLNLYGPSEDTTYSTGALIGPGEASPAIGLPVDGKRALLLDPAFEPVPVGVPGEIFVGGAGLARGYLGRPALTAERFVPDPFGALRGEPGARLYRTGDLARRRPGGAIEFLGRVDFQVKVRGFRIELGEVEAAVSAHPEVGACTVLAADGPGGPRLVAYVVPDRGARLTPAGLRRSLRSRIPEFMVPSAFVLLEELPVTPHGKVDREALSRLAPPPEEGAAAEFIAPRTPLEETMAEICREVLRVERIGMGDNFFDLGGHSLLATHFIALLRDRVGVEIPLQAMFETPALGDLADLITERELASADEATLTEVMADLEGLAPEEWEALLAEARQDPAEMTE